jgi:hypothetical protein
MPYLPSSAIALILLARSGQQAVSHDITAFASQLPVAQHCGLELPWRETANSAPARRGRLPWSVASRPTVGRMPEVRSRADLRRVFCWRIVPTGQHVRSERRGAVAIGRCPSAGGGSRRGHGPFPATTRPFPCRPGGVDSRGQGRPGLRGAAPRVIYPSRDPGWRPEGGDRRASASGLPPAPDRASSDHASRQNRRKIEDAMYPERSPHQLSYRAGST